MDVSSHLIAILTICIITFVLNLFFGYFRARERKFSFKWFLCIHLPIPLVAFARLYSHLDYGVIPIFLVVAVAGQIIGGKVDI
jgi:hypothetical protein